MRVGVVIDLAGTAGCVGADLAADLEDAGIDLMWLRPRPQRPYEALAVAASCASRTGSLLVGAEVRTAHPHPVYLAEERNVVDQLLGGRLVLGVDTGADASQETIDVLLGAGGTAPFRHDGERWQVPANLPSHRHAIEERTRVTPPPFALEPAIWLLGARCMDLAARYCLSPLVGEDADGSATWGAVSGALRTRGLRLRRPGTRAWDPTTQDAACFAARVADERDRWGMDTLLVRLTHAPATDGWHAAVAELARAVRPRLQLHRFPAGLERLWQQTETTPTTRLDARVHDQGRALT